VRSCLSVEKVQEFGSIMGSLDENVGRRNDSGRRGGIVKKGPPSSRPVKMGAEEGGRDPVKLTGVCGEKDWEGPD